MQIDPNRMREKRSSVIIQTSFSNAICKFEKKNPHRQSGSLFFHRYVLYAWTFSGDMFNFIDVGNVTVEFYHTDASPPQTNTYAKRNVLSVAQNIVSYMWKNYYRISWIRIHKFVVVDFSISISLIKVCIDTYEKGRVLQFYYHKNSR